LPPDKPVLGRQMGQSSLRFSTTGDAVSQC
jgi:hypothetical protein